MTMKKLVARHGFIETAPLQLITVERSLRASIFETILEESMTLAGDFVWGATNIQLYVEIAPAPLITAKKQSFNSTLDTIWEESMHYAEHFVSEAAGRIVRPALRLNYLEDISNHFCVPSDNLQKGVTK